jgi:hypothetical protein
VFAAENSATEFGTFESLPDSGANGSHNEGGNAAAQLTKPTQNTVVVAQ